MTGRFSTRWRFQDPSAVTLRLTRGGVQQLVAKPSAEGAVPVLEDVVLPLHNLSAYLYALGDRAVSQLGAQASKITARRIDEFLLAFGGAHFRS